MTIIILKEEADKKRPQIAHEHLAGRNVSKNNISIPIYHNPLIIMEDLTGVSSYSAGDLLAKKDALIKNGEMHDIAYALNDGQSVPEDHYIIPSLDCEAEDIQGIERFVRKELLRTLTQKD